MDLLLTLTELGVEILIKKNKLKNTDIFWDNYSVVIWDKSHNGFFNNKGMFRKNSWGISNKFQINKKGLWEFPLKYVKNFK